MRWVCRVIDGETRFIPAHEAEPLVSRFSRGPQIIAGNMEPTYSHVDGKIYTCQKKMERNARALGAVCIGNDKITPNTTVDYDAKAERELEAQIADVVNNI